jgi:hypothetical protein
MGEGDRGMGDMGRRGKTQKMQVRVKMSFSFAKLANKEFSRMLSQRITNFRACSVGYSDFDVL